MKGTQLHRPWLRSMHAKHMSRLALSLTRQQLMVKGYRLTHYWGSTCGHCAFKAPVKAKYCGAQLCRHNVCKHGLH